jgi:hypothetical protein
MESPGNMRHQRYVYGLRQNREKVAAARWLFRLRNADLLDALGVREPLRWCGLFLPRREIFGEDFDGDVDILAGPLESVFTKKELDQPIADHIPSVGVSLPRPETRHEVLQKVIKPGEIRWPPRLRNVVACETKVSWFDTDSETWERTHQAEGGEVKGSLKRKASSFVQEE